MLVVVEVALSLVLLIGAGLLVRSFSSLQQVRPGFDPENALTFQLDLPRTGYRTLDARVSFFRELEGRLRALPGVTAVGGISQLPLTGSGPLAPYAYNEETSRNWESVTADGRGVTPGFFAAMGTRLVSGRDFTNDDVRGRAPIVIIDESLAKRAFAGIANPVGHRLQVGPVGEENNFATVVGIVEHIRMHDLGAERLPHIYRPYYESPFGGLGIVVRSTLDPAVLASSVRRVVAELDKELPVNDLLPMSHYVSRGLESARFTLILMQVVGAMALFLSAIGIYGVISYAVGQRTKEFGVRMALGQTPAGLRLAVVIQGFRLIMLSIAVGLVAASLTTRLLGGMLYDVSPRDPLTFALVALFLMGVALVACYVPARRASRVDPLMALRAE
jgi:putative ABC transport system permease protein